MPHQCTNCGTVFEDGSTEMLSGCPECSGTTFQYHPGGTDHADGLNPDAQPPDRPETDDTVARTVGNAAQTVRNFIGGSEEPGTGVDPDEADPLSPWPSDTTPAPTERADTEVTARLETKGSAPERSERRRVGAETATGTTHTETEAGTTPAESATGTRRRVGRDALEDEAQASARSAVVSPDELPKSARNADLAVGSPGGASAAGPTSGGPAADDGSPGEDRPDLAELREELNDQFESIRIVEPGQYELNLMELYEREEYIIALQEDGRYQIQVPETWRD